MTRALFNKHYYNFGGHVYHQRGGGPIGLRGTCAVARAVMQMFDILFKERLREARIDTWLLARYVDDARAFLQPMKPGWRYDKRGLVFSLAWAREDTNLTPTEVTKRVIEGAMRGIENFLEFTYETCEDKEFKGWLPTLDTCLRINENNVAEYKYYEKQMVSTKTLQRRAAMEENTKMNILANDMMRRLLTTKEELGAECRGAVVDQYGAKLLRSGYSKEQTQRILINGIKGFENKRRSRLNQGRSLRNTAKMSIKDRYKKKLLEKSNWYKKRKSSKDEKYKKVEQKKSKREAKKRSKDEQPVPKTILFVEHTAGGELAHKLRELTRRLAPTIGFSIKIVERAGATLRSSFPLANLWEDQKCGREDCVPCEQGAEKIQPCYRSSLVYENICKTCNPGADPGKEQPNLRTDIPTVYVGETSRSLYERMREHQGAWRSQKVDSHMHIHHLNEHKGAEKPEFIVRAAKFHRTALSRQLGEAVRIRRRGGAGSILNSKSEYDRCKIPRLILEETDEEQISKEEEQRMKERMEQLDTEEQAWGDRKRGARNKEQKSIAKELGTIGSRTNATKRDKEEQKGARSKKFKHQIIREDWGREQPMERKNPPEDSSLYQPKPQAPLSLPNSQAPQPQSQTQRPLSSPETSPPLPLPIPPPSICSLRSKG